jgi:hypothetical protein
MKPYVVQAEENPTFKILQDGGPKYAVVLSYSYPPWVMRSKDSFNKYFSRVSCVPSIVLGTE